MRIIKNPPRADERGIIAQVSYADSSGFGVVGASELRDSLVFAPRGVSYMPCTGDNLLILPVNGTDTCVGALSSVSGLKPGELRLRSSGGAVILLRQNGDIQLNGVIITKDGEIITPE